MAATYLTLHAPFAAHRVPVVDGRFVAAKYLTRVLRCTDDDVLALAVHEDRVCNARGRTKVTLPCIDIKAHGVKLMRDAAGWPEDQVKRGCVQLGIEEEQELPIRKRARSPEEPQPQPQAAAMFDQLAARLERVEALVAPSAAALDEFEAAMMHAFAQLRQRLGH